MSQNLVIVESPAKAKTIKKYLGKDFEVLASYGHVRDLVEKEGAVDPAHGFAMKYQVIERNKPKVDAIEKALRKADTLYLATDPDREGEAISWHLSEILKDRGALAGKEVHRVRFNEITPNAIRAAIANADAVNDNLVNAQQARRALDYLVGFTLSPLLWKKIKPGLSAGRVQSVALRLICEREAEIARFVRNEYWTLQADATKGKAKFAARLAEYRGRKFEADTDKLKFTLVNEADAREAENSLRDAAGGALVVENITKKPKRVRPTPPFKTSTLQQEAARKLGYTAKRTMMAAQKLYEAGFITYMRTDSISLSRDAIVEIRDAIKTMYGDKSLPEQAIFYKTQSKNAQEAHEAIRPTSALRTPQQVQAEVEADEARLYQLIWRKAIASQMTEAVYDTVAVDLVPAAKPGNHRLRANGSTLVEPGYLAAYREDRDEDDKVVEDEADDASLPVMEVGERVTLAGITTEQHFTQPPPRFTEASLVKALEGHGIGRPSTYASIIETLRNRYYVEMNGRAFVPTDIGKIVSRFLVKYIPGYFEYDFTAKMEDKLDEIADGSVQWQPELERFWRPFSSVAANVEKNVTREQVAESREVGRDPVSGKPISVRMGAYGPFVQLGTKDDVEKPKFASLMPGQKMDQVTLEDALKLLSLPKSLGVDAKGQPVSVGRGQFGPYVKYGAKYVSIKEDDPFTITLPRALELIVEKEKADAERTILDFPDAGIQVLKGRYGPYITDKKKNAKIPKDREPSTLTLAECLQLLAEAPERKGGRFGRRGGFKKSAKKTAAPAAAEAANDATALPAAAKRAGATASAPKKKAAVKKKAAPRKKATKAVAKPAA